MTSRNDRFLIVKPGDPYHRESNKRTKHAGSKNEAGGPEKQVIQFVWPYGPYEMLDLKHII